MTIKKEVFVGITVPFPDNPKLFPKVMNMLLIIEDLKSYLRFFVSVIARLDRAIQKKELDYPVKRLCHNVILRPKPKNLGLITHRFHEILHFVQNDKFTVQGNCDTASKPDNDKHRNRVRYE